MIPAKAKLGRINNRDIERTYVGEVVDHEDPNKLGRLKVRVPELYGSIPKDHIPWANPAEPFGGSSDYGHFYIPIPGSKVRIRLWRGHAWFPEWYGVHWFKGEPPNESQINPPHNYVIKTPKHHLIDLHDDNQYMRVKDFKGNYIILHTRREDIMIEVHTDSLVKEGGNSDETVGAKKRTKVGSSYSLGTAGPIHIKVTGSGDIAIDGAPNIWLNSGKAKPETPKEPFDVTHEPTGGGGEV
jgi:hypothetical protein